MKGAASNHRFGIACAALAVPLVALAFAGQASAAVTCDKVASPTGSDSAAGTVEQPLATAEKLVQALAPGQTGCLRSGLYATDQDVKLEVPNITLTSYPGERATVQGRIWIADAAPDSTVSDLDIDGRNDRDLPSPTINGDRATLSGNDITNHHTTICISVGSPPNTWGRAEGTVIEGNRIHGCGALPATNFDHGIYVNSADDTIIRDNLIYDNADRGVQLYPDAQRSIVTGNVIDGNGEGVLFAGTDTTASSGNIVEHNVITNSKLRDNVEAAWGAKMGTGNVVRENCVGGGHYDDGDGGVLAGAASKIGFQQAGNIVEVPDYADPANGDFSIPASSPCAGFIAGAITAAGGTQGQEAAQLAVTLDTNKKKIPRLVPVKVQGTAPGASAVSLVALGSNGSWHRIGSATTNDSGAYRMRVRLRRPGRETVKAMATGLTDSRPVKLRVEKN